VPTPQVLPRRHRLASVSVVYPSRRCWKRSGNADRFADRSAFEHIADILVSTPLRLVHALQHQFVSLDQVEHIVIDEADRLFENGFEHQVGDCTKSMSEK
jgi:superfamily II DNA/RNA helicase